MLPVDIQNVPWYNLDTVLDIRKCMHMEFHEKLQNLRKQKRLTQEELAQQLHVSRTAISKWESGRGYPNIDSLKLIAKAFSVTVDELLAGEELLTLAEEDSKRKQSHFLDAVFGLLDFSGVMLSFLPLFRQKDGETIQAVSLFGLTEVSVWLRVIFSGVVLGIVMFGIIMLALQNCQQTFWVRNKYKTSIILNTVGVLIFLFSLHPYGAAYLLLYLLIKAFLLLQKR